MNSGVFSLLDGYRARHNHCTRWLMLNFSLITGSLMLNVPNNERRISFKRA